MRIATIPIHCFLFIFFLIEIAGADHLVGISFLYNPFSIEKAIRQEISPVWITGNYQYAFRRHGYLSAGFSLYNNNKGALFRTQKIVQEITIPISVCWTPKEYNAGFNIGGGVEFSIFPGGYPRKFAVYPFIDIGYLWSIANRFSIGILMRNIIDYDMLYVYRPTLGIEGKFNLGHLFH